MSGYIDDLLARKNVSGVLPYVYHDGAIRPSNEGMVSIASHTLQYGVGAFGGIRGNYRDGKISILRLYDHYVRIMDASIILGLNYHIEFEEFRKIFEDMVAKNAPKTDVYFRPFLHCDQMILAPRRHPKMKHVLSMYMVEMGNYVSGSMRLKTSSYPKFSDGTMSTKAKVIGGYVHSFLANQEAVMAGFDEALVLDAGGYAVEANVANIIVLYRDRILVPPIGSSALEGITLRTAIDLLRDKGYVVEETNIDRSMIYTCQEMVMTGTAVRVIPVSNVDGREIGMLGAEKRKKKIDLYEILKGEFNFLYSGKHQRSKDYLFHFNSSNG